MIVWKHVSPCWMLNKAYHGKGYAYEAAYAYKTSVESNSDANALLVYFKHRTVSFLVVSVCLAYLMCGLFMDTVTWIWDHFSDIFEPAKWGMVN